MGRSLVQKSPANCGVSFRNLKNEAALDRVWLQREENKKENKNKQEKEELQY
jgi:hypothetical protein